MPRKMATSLTEVELAFMEVFWAGGELSPEEMRIALSNNGRELTGGSVRKMLLVLVKKGYIERRKEGKKYIYRAVIGNRIAKRDMVSELIERAFGGSVPQMVAALLDCGDVPDSDIKHIEKLIDAHKKRRHT